MLNFRSNGNAANVMLHLPEVLGADKVQLSWKLLEAQCGVINLERKKGCNRGMKQVVALATSILAS